MSGPTVMAERFSPPLAGAQASDFGARGPRPRRLPQPQARSCGRPVVIAAGGTGGHLFPAEALAAALAARGEPVVLMIDTRAAASAAFAGLDVHVLPGAGIAGRSLRRGVAAACALTWGGWRARGLLRGLDAQAVVGFGGYPSVAPALGAFLSRPRPRVVLHEQNAVLGRANRLLVRRAACLALSFADTALVPAQVAVVVTGNPVRAGILAHAGARYVPGPPLSLLVLGGSLGARVFADLVPAAVALLAAPLRARLAVTQQCRAEDLDRVRAAYDAAGVRATLAPFFADIGALLANTQLVVARAGASTIAEIATVGRPSLLVPLPGAIDDHQRANTIPLVAAGAAERLDQAGLDALALSRALTAWLSDPDRRTRAAAAAFTLSRADAAERLADLVLRVGAGESVP